MLQSLKRLNRFFLNEALYPLVFASVVAMGVFIFRVYFSRSLNYSNLVWNLVLAWIPYLISLCAIGVQRLFAKRRWWGIPPLLLFTAAWLLFFPNAPYILTDFYHLKLRAPLPLWFDIGMISLFAFSGCFLAIASLRSMQSIFRAYTGQFVSWVAITAAIAISAVGVYLGRFGRWNSWDLFTSPRTILKEIILPTFSPEKNLDFVGFTLMFTALLLVLYVMFVSFNHGVEEEEPNR